MLSQLAIFRSGDLIYSCRVTLHKSSIYGYPDIMIYMCNAYISNPTSHNIFTNYTQYHCYKEIVQITGGSPS